MNSNTSRSLTSLIIIIYPVLDTADSQSFCLVVINNCIAILCSSYNFRCISIRNTYLFNSILNCLAVLLLFQTGPCIAPLIISIQSYCLFYCYSICQKLHLYTVWSDTILIIIVRPYLIHCYKGHTGCILVLDIKAGNYRCIIRTDRFCNGICYFFTLFVLRQILKCPLPVIAVSYYLLMLLYAICQQMYCNSFRTITGLIIIIRPSLAAAYSQSCRCVAVGDNKAPLCTSCNTWRISIRHIYLFHCINNDLSCFHLIQAIPSVGPLI